MQVCLMNNLPLALSRMPCASPAPEQMSEVVVLEERPEQRRGKMSARSGKRKIFVRQCDHLRCLSDCDLVLSTPQGRYTLYQLSDPRVATLLGLAEELLHDVARGIYECTRYEQVERIARQEGEAHD